MGNIESLFREIDDYISCYQERVSSDNVQQVIDTFKRDWFAAIDYIDGEKYGEALIIYSAAIWKHTSITENDVKVLSEEIGKFDANESVKYKFGIKAALFGNLGLCWIKLGVGYRENAIASFKKHIYNLLLPTSHTKYSPVAYRFRSCSKYLFDDLRNQTIGLTSPSLFNDPFDCPIIELLNNDEDTSAIIRQAYQDCLKIACFSSNTKLPYFDEKKQERIQEEKQRGSMPEYTNELMWAHYADFHKGVCIKYHFPNSLTQLADGEDGVMCYFKDVSYSSQDLSLYSRKDSINLYDAFFLKGEKWMYENELRLLFFDITGKPGFHSIPAKNCIESVYFGLKCPQDHRDKIREILKDRIHEKVDLQGKRTSYPIKFYEMVIDKQHFGQVEAREIPPLPLGSDKLSTIKRICLFIRRIVGYIVK